MESSAVAHTIWMVHVHLPGEQQNANLIVHLINCMTNAGRIQSVAQSYKHTYKDWRAASQFIGIGYPICVSTN